MKQISHFIILIFNYLSAMIYIDMFGDTHSLFHSCFHRSLDYTYSCLFQKTGMQGLHSQVATEIYYDL